MCAWGLGELGGHVAAGLTCAFAGAVVPFIIADIVRVGDPNGQHCFAALLAIVGLVMTVSVIAGLVVAAVPTVVFVLVWLGIIQPG